jgi:hypothetical protein
MGKVKVNSGLASIIVLASLFAGWQTLLIVVTLLLLFCDIDDKLKDIIIKVVAFFAGIALVTLGWDLIVDLVSLVISTINNLVSLINNYLEYQNQISIVKLTTYLLNPIKTIVDIADGIITYLLTFAKFAFIVATLANKNVKENAIIKKINEFVSKIVTFVNNLDLGTAVSQQAPVQPTQPVQGEQVQNTTM